MQRWLSAFLFICISAFLLTACGFHPLYSRQGDNPNAHLVFGGVKIDPVPGQGKLNQQLRNDLEDRLNPDGVIPPNPAYRLSTTLTISEVAIGVSRDGTVSRYNVYLISTYQLFRTADDKPVTAGTVRHVSSYNNQTNEYFSTYVSGEDAKSRGVTELAELYQGRLASYFAEGAPVQEIKKPDPSQLVPQNPYLTNPFNADVQQQRPVGQ